MSSSSSGIIDDEGARIEFVQLQLCRLGAVSINNTSNREAGAGGGGVIANAKD